MKAEDVIYAEALEVQSALAGTNHFHTLIEATARLNAVINMALVLELATDIEIEAAKTKAKADYQG